MGMTRATGWVLALALAAAGPAGAQDWISVVSGPCERSGGARERGCETRSATLAPASRLEVDAGDNGGVRVTGWDRDGIEVVAHVQARARSAERARELLEEIRLVAADGRLRAEGPEGDRESWSVDWEVRVPRSTDLSLRTRNGGIRIADVVGAIDFSALNGGVRLDAVGGDVRGRTTNGGLHVELAGAEWQGHGLDAETTNGGVTLVVPEGYDAELETGTVNGGFAVAFPVTVQGRIGRSLRTTLGDGGATVRAVTTNGGVSIRRP